MAPAAVAAHGYLTVARQTGAPKAHDDRLRLALVDHVRRRDGLVLLSRDAAAQGAQRPALHPVLYIPALFALLTVIEDPTLNAGPPS